MRVAVFPTWVDAHPRDWQLAIGMGMSAAPTGMAIGDAWPVVAVSVLFGAIGLSLSLAGFRNATSQTVQAKGDWR